MKKRFQTVITIFFLFSLILPLHPVQADDNVTDWHYIDTIGGKTEAIAIFGNTLYLGEGLHIKIFDITNPKDPQLLGTSPLLPNFIENIFVNGSDYLYAACGTDGLQILDVSDPTRTKIVGSYNTQGYTEAVKIVGNYAFLADGPFGVQILDVTQPEAPLWLGEAYPMAYAYDVIVSGSTLYAAAGGSGLLIVDISDVSHPQEINLISMQGFVYSGTIHQDHLYTANAWGGIGVVNIADPVNPIVEEPLDTDGWVMSVYSHDSYLLAMDGADGARLYDLSAGSPKFKSAYHDVGFTLQGVFQGNNAYFTDKEKGLLIVNFLSMPSHPTLVDQYLPLLNARRAKLSNSFAYVASDTGLRIVDLTDVQHPVDAFWQDIENGGANDVVVSDGYAYVSYMFDQRNSLQVFDVNDPFHTAMISQIPHDWSMYDKQLRSLVYADGFLYSPVENFNISIDVRDPYNPKLLYSLPSFNTINAAVSGNLLVSCERKIELVDISDPFSLKPISTFEISTTGEAITFLDPTTIMATGEQGIVLIDVSDPISPRQISFLNLSSVVMDISIVGTTAYLASLGAGVQILDVSNPKDPRLIGSLETPGTAYFVSVEENTMLVADGVGGISIFTRNGVPPSSKSMQKENPRVANNNVPFDNWIPTDPSTFQNNPDVNTAVITTKILHQANPTNCIVTNPADGGEGSLRNCLNQAKPGMVITFDEQVFPPSNPNTILLASPLPEITSGLLTIDASNAGVILDGSSLESGSGITIKSSSNQIMGLQVVNFPEDGIWITGNSNRIGGNRLNGTSPTGEGNLVSGNTRFGISVEGRQNIISGNLIGTDISGQNAFPNYWGIMVSGLAVETIIGGTAPGEGNVVSGSIANNIDVFGVSNRIIGNYVGLDITGTKAIKEDAGGNIDIEFGSIDNIVGGTEPGERNIISGAAAGVIISDPVTYQNSIIGNYIGTDVTGTLAVPNNDGLILFSISYNRIGGTAPGESNLISGNRHSGIELNGYGTKENIILGNSFGFDAYGQPTLPNAMGISINMGQQHAIIGGFTPTEGNSFNSEYSALTMNDYGVNHHYFAGNQVSGSSVAGIFIKDGPKDNFFQGNSFTVNDHSSVWVNKSQNNLIRQNEYSRNNGQVILLQDQGNQNLIAPIIDTATSTQLAGTTCQGCRVEVYDIVDGAMIYSGITPIAIDGNFKYISCSPITSNTVAAISIDQNGNTSAFSEVASVSPSDDAIPQECLSNTSVINPFLTATPNLTLTQPDSSVLQTPSLPIPNPTPQSAPLPENKHKGPVIIIVITSIAGVLLFGLVTLMIRNKRKKPTYHHDEISRGL